jgi:hypothetical protein
MDEARFARGPALLRFLYGRLPGGKRVLPVLAGGSIAVSYPACMRIGARPRSIARCTSAMLAMMVIREVGPYLGCGVSTGGCPKKRIGLLDPRS